MSGEGGGEHPWPAKPYLRPLSGLCGERTRHLLKWQDNTRLSPQRWGTLPWADFHVSGSEPGDERKSRIKTGVAGGASGQSHLPAVRAVTGSFRCIKSGVKNSRRGLRLRSRFPRGYCRNEKTGVTRVFSATRDTLFRLDAPSKIAPHETKIEALPGAGKCDAQQKKDRNQEM